MAFTKCPECNNEISASASVCNYCGYPLAEEHSASMHEPAPTASTLKANDYQDKVSTAFNKDNRLKTITAIVMLLVGVYHGYYIFANFVSLINLIVDDAYLYRIFSTLFSVLFNLFIGIGFILLSLNLFTNRIKEYVKFCILPLALCNVFLMLRDIIEVTRWGFDITYFLNFVYYVGFSFLWALNALPLFRVSKNTLTENRKTIVLCATPMLFVLMVFFNNGVFFDRYSYYYGWPLVFYILRHVALVLYTYHGVESEEPKDFRFDNIVRQQNDTATSEDYNNMNTNTLPSATFPNGYNKIWVLIVLSICTFGIYAFVWIYQTVALYNEKQIGEQQSEAIQVVLCLFVPFYLIYWIYKYSKMTEEYTLSVGNTTNDLSIFALILSIFGLGLIAIALLQDQINKNLLLEYGITTSQRQPTPSYATTHENTATARAAQAERRAYTTQTAINPNRISDTDIEYLKKLKELNDMGILSDEEYTAQKEKVLANSN